MKFEPTKLEGVFTVIHEPHGDKRGSFTRLWGENEFEAKGLEANLNNIGVSFNKTAGTLRGMHFQRPPFEEAKVVQCTKGRIYDVVVDIRRNSPSFGEWNWIELHEGCNKAIYIPKGFAHGFQTLEDDTEVMYFISDKYDKESADGIRWNDSRFGITFPLDVTVINERDANFPNFDPE